MTGETNRTGTMFQKEGESLIEIHMTFCHEHSVLGGKDYAVQNHLAKPSMQFKDMNQARDIQYVTVEEKQTGSAALVTQSPVWFLFFFNGCSSTLWIHIDPRNKKKSTCLL